MTRLWRSAKQRDARRGKIADPHDLDAVALGAELVAAEDDVLDHYAVRPVRPAAQLAARVGLWSAVGLGVLGGLVGIVRPPAEQVQPVVERSNDSAAVPAPVAGMAELVVEEWLTATGQEDDALDELFVDPPSRDRSTPGDLSVRRATTVSGQQRDDGYWSVTVAADVVETVPVDESEGAAAASGAEEREAVTSTWFVEVAIVGDVGGGLAALTTPAVVPAPPQVSTDWRASASRPMVAGESPLATTVEGFLAAVLTGVGDPSRYLAPGGELSAADPPPFVEVELAEIGVDELGEGNTRVLAVILATTPGEARLRLTYEVVLAERSDRWEVVRFAGAPTILVGGSPDTPPDTPSDAPETSDAEPSDGPDRSESPATSSTATES